MIRTENIHIYGIVQGVGFRPFVSRAAQAVGVTGSVANRGSYVEIYVRGDEEARGVFREKLRTEAPERAIILGMDVRECDDKAFDDFTIIESEHETGDIFVSPDIAICPKCRQELFDPADRRYLHPFINCTACGPRLTILDAMPYDRERTSMGVFPLCPECEWEYTHPETRRYDAQPVCCHDCGPRVYILQGRAEKQEKLPDMPGLPKKQEKLSDMPGLPKKWEKVYAMAGQAEEKGAACPERIMDGEAVTLTRRILAEGGIAAVKGIGGFHLCCDATNEEAVDRLRRLKHRPSKPFAVMMKDLRAVRRECVLEEGQEEILDGHQKPILLLSRKRDSILAAGVAPGNPRLGVMLPYVPVQMLLFNYPDDVPFSTDCLIMTSGNISGAPICRSDEDAIQEIGAFCDIILSHDRKIRLRADDSVMDFYQGTPYMIRRSRGYAPLPVMLSGGIRGQVLAVGGELKNTFCLAKDALFYPSPYVGDMADVRTVQALRESIQRMEELLEIAPSVVACDLHPEYNTGILAGEMGLPVVGVQHHHAHIVSCMAENDYMQQVIGVALDGTGYGTDGTIWGGELLLADARDFERVGSICPFPQAGGDASAREGWRIAVSLVNELFSDEAASVTERLGLCEEEARSLQQKMAERGINCVTSTSAGRVFDAVSAVLGICRESTFEGEAATALQFAAERYCDANKIKKHMNGLGTVDRTASPNEENYFVCGDKAEMDDDAPVLKTGQVQWAPIATDDLFRKLVQRRLAGDKADYLAFLFHKCLAQMVVQACVKLSEETGIKVCALSGGVFQNTLFLRLCDEGLEENGLRVLKHSMLPPNDGGIALGQAVIAQQRIQECCKFDENFD